MAEGEGQREGGCDCLSAKAYRSVGGHQLGHPVHGFGAVGEEVRVLRRRGRALRWRARHEKTSRRGTWLLCSHCRGIMSLCFLRVFFFNPSLKVLIFDVFCIVIFLGTF